MTGLVAYIPDATPTTGAASVNVKPLTEGKPVAVNNAQAQGSTSLWSKLDDLGDQLFGSLGNLVDAAAKGKAKELAGDLANTDTRGSPADQPGGGVADASQPFYVRYKSELVLAGGVVATLGLLYWVAKG